MTVDIALYRARIGLLNRYKHVKSTICFTFLPYALRVLLAQLILIVALLLIRCGDVEINPGPISSNISLWSSNVRGLNSDLIDCLLADVANKHDLLGICETFLNLTSNVELSIPGYLPIFRKDRLTHGGGVALYVSDLCIAKRLYNFETPTLEALWVEIKTQTHVLAVCVCYRSQTEGDIFWENIQDSVESIRNAGYNNLIIFGDFNADHGNRPMWNKFRYFCQSVSLNFHISEATRITSTSATTLDQILTSDNIKPDSIAIHPPLGRSDHCQVSTNIPLIKVHRPSAYNRLIWQYDKADWDGFNEALLNNDWNPCFVDIDVDVCASRWTDNFINLARTFIPNKMTIIRPWDNPWYTSKLRCLRRRRDRIYKRAKNNRTIQTWELYKVARNNYVRELKSAKDHFEQRQIDKINNFPSSRPWWQTVKSLFKTKNKSTAIPALSQQDGSITNDPYEKATSFNNFFLENSKIDTTGATLPDTKFLTTARLTSITFTRTDILDILKLLDPNKASGPDYINPKMLKHTAVHICSSLTRLFNMSMQQNKFPSLWKKANVSPLFKKGDASQLNNYRPISLLSCVGKVMEKAVFKYTFNYIRDNHLIYSNQSGFMPGHSTTHQLVHLYHVFCEALDNKKKVRLVFADISKAFDRVWHAGILHKLKNNGITGSLNEWFSDYLTDRKQCVVINGHSSEYGTIEAGVPQGSVLGPLLFLIFIDDIKEGLESKISLFVDDSLFYMVSNLHNTNKDVLDRDLIRIDTWSKQLLVTFSIQKTCDMSLSLRPTAAVPMPLSLSGANLESVSVHKHLGLTFSSDLKWNNHVDDINARADKRLCQLEALRFKLNRKTLEILYISYIRPIVEYSDVAFDNISDGDNTRLIRMQKRAGKTVSGAIKGTAYATILSELGWESLQARRERRKLILFADIVHGNAPSYLQQDLPPSVQLRTQNRYQLRNRSDLSQFHTRTETFRNSFFPIHN